MLSVLRFDRIIAVILGLLPVFASGQKWEVGGFAGTTNYTGDLARQIVLSESGVAAGVLGRYNFNGYFSWRPGFNFGRISGGDYNFKEFKTRNLSFFSSIFEFDNRLEFNFQRFGTSTLAKRHTGFVFAGLNVFYFNPKTRFNGEVYTLQPIGTEGQRLEGHRRYYRIGIAIPLGIGYKFSISQNWVLGAELGFRKTFTDYLDDVSGLYPDFAQLAASGGNTAVRLSDRSMEISPYEQRAAAGDWRGNPHLKDWYMMAGVTLTYRFTPILCGFSNF